MQKSTPTNSTAEAPAGAGKGAPVATPRNQRANWSEEIATFLVGLDEYRPTVPESVSQYYAQKAGCSAEDPRVIKFLSMACDKYLCDIINDAKQFSQLRQRGVNSGTTKAATKRKAAALEASIQKTEIFEMEDLSRSLEQRNIYVRRKIGVAAEMKFVRDEDVPKSK